MTITLEESADYVQNAVHDGTLALVEPSDKLCCESPDTTGDYGVCGATAFVFIPSDPEKLKALFAEAGKVPEEGKRYRDNALCLRCAADYLRERGYGK